MFDDEDDDSLYYDDDEDYYGPCMCRECRSYRLGYWAGYYDALDSLEGLP